MSFTSKFFAKTKIQLPFSERKGRKFCRSIRKCGNCLKATLTYKEPLDGLKNLYKCEKTGKTVLNTDPACEDFDNRWRKRI